MKMIKGTKVKILMALLALFLVGSNALYAASAATQLEKGKQLYSNGRYDEAMDYFIDVLVSGTRAQSEEANQYINRIHNNVGGIQSPVEVDINFKEGEAKRLKQKQEDALQEQVNAVTDPIVQELDSVGQYQTAAQDALAMKKQEIAEAAAAAQASADQHVQNFERDLAGLYDDDQDDYYNEDVTDVSASGSSSTFNDLTSPSALQARQVYSSQKLESMKQAAIAKLEKAKGVRIYFRNNLPDAIDIDSEVLFDGYKFRPEALTVLDDVYTLMALTQGAGYIILPPGSYTDNITLSGIRQAMALNSFLVHKGLSSGKISYNMGLFDQEPPAKFANLEGISIVFDFDAELPASLPEAVSVNKLPMLSMAVVPVSNKIDPAAGEAFAIDFSVIETKSPIENWLFQIIQHAGNDTYYVVRQLEGFSPVYHQILWNGRKGIIGPELACGTYTLSLTAVDVKGEKSTLRRQINVDCTLNTSKKTTAAKKTTSSSSENKSLDYKSARLWTKPGRVMKAAPSAAQTTEIEDPFMAANAASNAADTYAVQQTPSYGDYNAAANYGYGQQQSLPAQTGVNNPYDMPYDNYGDN